MNLGFSPSLYEGWAFRLHENLVVAARWVCMSSFQTHYLLCSILSPQRIDRKSFYFFRSPLRLGVCDTKPRQGIPVLFSWRPANFFHGSREAGQWGELVLATSLCLLCTGSFVSTACVYVAWCNAVCLASALSLQKLWCTKTWPEFILS